MILEPMLAAPVWWYAAACRYPVAAVDAEIPYDKRRKEIHRFTIASVHGPLTVTVPVSRPAEIEPGKRLTWKDLTISAHDSWWTSTADTLATAYGGTPWFRYLFPAFEQFFTEKVVGKAVSDYLTEMDVAIRTAAKLPCRFSTTVPPGFNTVNAKDLDIYVPEYRQVRAAHLGFVPGLSILDALFNLGPDETAVLVRGSVNY